MAGPLPPTPSPVIKVELTFNDGGDTNALTRFYMSYSGSSPSSSNIATWLASGSAYWSSAMDALFANTVIVETAIGTDLFSAGGATGLSNWSITGTRSGTQPPRSVVANCHYQITRRYRGGKARGAWPAGVTTDYASSKAWNGSFTGAFTTGVNSFMAGLASIALGSATVTGQVNVSYFSGFQVITSPTTGRARNVPKRLVTPIVDNVVGRVTAAQFGSQRRRLMA